MIPADIPRFPANDEQVKTIAILGYTGVGKTSVITAAYSENILYGKDAFTQRFFQRIEDEIRLYGQIPLTMGEASTLSFIESASRTEFTVQDFSGEHIKLERKNEQNYHNLIVRADNAHALVCMLSAQSFYQQGQIHEEVDAIQTFVNRLRGLGTRIPVAVVLTKCDAVPRFYFNVPVLKSVCKFLSFVPFLSLPPQRGLEVTRRRFSKVFSGLDFKGKGPRTVFTSIALPRLAGLKAWQWPRAVQWLVVLARKLMISPKFLFQRNYQLQEPFNFCFQAFQIGILRNLLVRHHHDGELCRRILEQFEEEVIAAKPYGDNFHFRDYFDRILEDTKSLIAEMEEETRALTQTADRLLANERELAQNLEVWLGQAAEKICKFNKPWSEGARKSLEKLRHDTLRNIRDRLQERITETLGETGENTFYRLIDILKIRRQISVLEIWKTEDIVLPEVESFQKRLIEHLVVFTLSRDELSMARFQEDRNKYLEVITIAPPPEMALVEELAQATAGLQINLNQYQTGVNEWDRQILQPLATFQQKWLKLGRHFDLSTECNLRRRIETEVMSTLRQEAGNFKSLAQILNWAAETEQLLNCEGSQKALRQVVETAKDESQELLAKTLDELTARAQKCLDNRRQFPSRLEEWFDDCRQREGYLKMIAGNKGMEELNELQRQVLSQAKDFLDQIVKETLESSLLKLKELKEDRATFMAVSEVLLIHKEIDQEDILSRHGFALPAVGELEKALFYHLTLATLPRRGLSYALYEQDRARFTTSVKSADAFYLKSLDNLVLSFEAIGKGAKEMSSLPVSEWEGKILSPVRTFHHSWLELAGHFDLPQAPALRMEAEEIAVRSLLDRAVHLKLRQMRDWVASLYPMLQSPEHRRLLDDMVSSFENDVRIRLKSDLEEFMGRCQDLEKACQSMDRKSAGVDETWQKFSGSVTALAYNVAKFPHTELSLDENIQKILDREGPEQVKKSLGEWVHALDHNRILSLRRCRAVDSVLAKLRDIFQRPEAFSAIGEQIDASLKRFQRRRVWWMRLALAGCLVVACLAMLGAFRVHISRQARDVAAFAEEHFNRHEEIAARWERLLKYPAWLIPSGAAEEATLHRQLAFLSEIENQAEARNATEQQLVQWQRQLEEFMATGPSGRARLKACEAMLAVRSLQLILDLPREKKPAEFWEKELEELKQLERQIKKDLPIFKSHLLEEAEFLCHKPGENGR